METKKRSYILHNSWCTLEKQKGNQVLVNLLSTSIYISLIFTLIVNFFTFFIPLIKTLVPFTSLKHIKPSLRLGPDPGQEGLSLVESTKRRDTEETID